MRSIRIIIFFENIRYAESLARGLCYEYAGLNVFFAEDIKKLDKQLERGILLTDKALYDPQKTIYFYSGDRQTESQFTYCISKGAAVRDILKVIRRVAFEQYGIKPELCDNSKKIEIFSQKGGSGVTSFAIVLARIMALKTESKVLYVNLGEVDDYWQLAGIDYYSNLSKKQYVFMKEEALSVHLEEYCKEDDFGVSFFKPDIGVDNIFHSLAKKELMAYLDNEKFFSYIIADSGKRNCGDREAFNISLEVSRGQVKLFSSENEYITYQIVEDEYAFKSNGKNIAISMLGDYANSIETFIEESEILL